jgi:hypothetical protein
LNEKNVTFKPMSKKNVKVYQLEFVLDDSYSPPGRYPFKVTVEDPMNSKLLKTGDFENSTLQISMEIIKAQLRIQQVTRDGKLKLMIIASKEASLITKMAKET